MGLLPMDVLDPWKYAENLGVMLLDFQSLDISAATKARLVGVDSDSWSGLTLKARDVVAILLNPSHFKTRQASTLMHEISHILLKHIPSRVDISETGMLLLSDYSDEAEEEADWLSGALLLPRDSLVCRRRRGESVSHIATSCGISEALCQWRLQSTGVDLQLRRS